MLDLLRHFRDFNPLLGLKERKYVKTTIWCLLALTLWWLYIPLKVGKFIPNRKLGNTLTAILLIACISIAIATMEPPAENINNNQFAEAGINENLGSQLESEDKDRTDNENIIRDEEAKDVEPHNDESIAENPVKLREEIKVHYLNVGQGDSILVTSPSFNMLIDGGSRSRGQAVVNYITSQGVSSLDLVVGTHPHEDHIGGLIEVFKQIPVKEVLDPGVAHTTKTYEDYLTKIDEMDIKFTIARKGESREIPNGIKLEVLSPTRPSYNHLNDASVVIRLTYGEVSFLFTGDAEIAAEAEMLKSGDVKADILKVGHHGSITSTSRNFLEAVNPKLAIIQVGAGNRYSHPNDPVLERLTAAGARIYRTDFHGTIVVTTDGNSYWSNSESQ